MSNNSALTELGQEIVAQYSPSLIAYYVQVSAAALVLYDYLLTLPLELLLIWNGKANLMKALFFVNRYGGLTFQYTIMFMYFYKPALDTDTFNYINNITDVLSNAAIYSIFTLRTFAIYGRSWTVFFVLAILGLADAAANIWLAVVQTASAVPQQLQVGPFTCDYTASSSAFAGEKFFDITTFSHASIGQLTSIISATIFDAVVVILTVSRTYRLAKLSREIRRSLSYIFLRDGLFYYIAVFLPLYGEFVMSTIALKDDNADLSIVADYFETIFTAVRNVAVNRLVLSLSHAANYREDSEYRTQTGIDPPVFASNSTLGNIGGLVHSGLDDFDEELSSVSIEEEEGNIDNGTNIDFQGNSGGIEEVEGLDAVTSHSGSGGEFEQISV